MKAKLIEYYSQFKSNRLFKKTTKTYFIIACMVFLSYALVMIFNVYNAAVTQLVDAEQKMLSQAETTNDFILRDTNSTATDIFETDQRAINAMTKPYTHKISIDTSNLTEEMKSRTSAISKVYFFNLDDNHIYTSDNPVYTRETFPDKELLNLVTSTPRYIVNKPHILKYEEKFQIKEKRILLSLYKYSDTSCMAVMLDSDLFNSMVNTDFENKNQSMMILKSDGIVLSATDSALFGKDLSDNKIIQQLEKAPEQSGYINKFGTMYCYRKSNTLNSLYVCSFRTSSVIVSFGWQIMIILLFALLLIVMYFISSMHITMSVFRPFKKLRNDFFDILGISQDNENEGTEQELELISKNLINIKNEYDAMLETEHLYSATKQNELIYYIMTGSYNYDEKELEEYNIRFPYPYITLILIRLDNTKNIERSNIGLIQYGIAHAGTEIFTQQDNMAYYTTYSDEYDVIFMVNHKNPVFDTNRISLIQKYATNAFGITISASHTTEKGNIESVVEMYRNVKYAMQYRIVKGHNTLIDYSSLLTALDSRCEYPAKLEKTVLREINQKNNTGADEAVKEFLRTVSNMPYIYIIVHSYVLLMAINAHASSNKQSDEQQQDALTDDLTRCETLDDIYNIIISSCNTAIIAASDIKIDDKHMIIANNIEDYINSHYSDPNLSIDTIASYVNKSANYTRSIFKQNKNISISDYIAKKRFDKVCRMLRTTNLTAQSIAQKVGMSPGSYFYTAFKKYTGYTPEQYRKKYMKNNQN